MGFVWKVWMALQFQTRNGHYCYVDEELGCRVDEIGIFVRVHSRLPVGGGCT